MKEIPKCQICKKESIELFEKKTEKGILWACSKCAPLRYKTTRGEIKDARRKIK